MTEPHPVGVGDGAGITLEHLGRFESGQFDQDAAEIIAHSESVESLFVVNADLGGVDVLDVKSPGDPERIDQLVLEDVWADAGEVTNVALRDALAGTALETPVLAVSVVASTPQDPGRVVFYDAVALTPIGVVEVGAVPDKVSFTPDGTRVLTANSGEPSADYTRNPRGSVSIVDLRDGMTEPPVEHGDFTAYDGREDELRDQGIRIFGPDPKASTNLAPEYLTVGPDSETAYVVLQVNNALAEIDIAARSVEAIHALGYKDHRETGNELDASDVDRFCIRNWPVYGMYQPDAITAYTVGDETYLLTANEGGMRDTDAYSEVTQVKDLELDRDAFDLTDIPNVDSVEELQRPENLGNLLTTTATGDVDNDGVHEELYAFGGRSVSIWTIDGELVWDSGADFELLVAMHHPEYFNTDGLRNAPFVQSTVKGPEPEGVTIGEVENRIYAFVGLERIGSVVVYDITDPHEPRFVQYINDRNFDVDLIPDVEDGPVSPDDVGDLGPEGVTFIPAAASPVQNPLVAVGNELSGTTTLYRIHHPRDGTIA